MYWNHRILRDKTSEEIVEVFYDDDGSPLGWAEVGPFAYEFDDVDDSRVSFEREVEQMRQAFEQPVLTPEDFKGDEE